MKVFRLGKRKYIKDLSGKGAESTGGRWNSKGVPMIYTSASRALCATEIAVHTPLGNIPFDYFLAILDIPDDIKIVEPPRLPFDWKALPHPDSTQVIGDKFSADSVYAVMKVPSAVVQGDFNYVINPNHPDAKRIKIVAIEEFVFDERLFLKL